MSEALNMLKHCSVEGEPNIYVLGSYEGRVTIHSQQIRALNLIYALKTLGKLNREKSGQLQVAVVGGGIGGMTAAVAAARQQASVTVFERHSELLHNLRGCHTRHLHPNIYDWPAEVAAQDKTNLPFLNWSAGSADSVATELIKQWKELANPGGPISVKAPVEICIRDCLPEGRRRITIVSHPHEELTFDVIILAVGFGVEKHLPPQPLRSYWRDDSLHQPEIELRGERTRYLVSGNGDGGLIDVLRLRLRDFKHENLISDFKLDILEQKDELKRIEEQIASVAEPDRTIYERYEELKKPNDLDMLLLARLRSDTAVTLNYNLWPFSHRSSLLHRYLVYRLMKIDSNLRTQPGNLIAVDGHEPNLTAHFDVDGQKHVGSFQRVVVRHGPVSAMGRDFSKLHGAFQTTLGARNALDDTRRPLWSQGFFDESSSADNSSGGTASVESPTGPESAMPNISSNPTPHVDSAKLQLLTGPISEFATQLRDELRQGEADSVTNKFNLLDTNDKAWVLNSVWKASLADDNALAGLKQLLECGDFDSDNVRDLLTQLVKESVFKPSLARKESILRLGPSFLNLVDRPVLEEFFDSLIKLVERDQYSEVNVIMPALAKAQDAIPDSLYWKYFQALVRQSRSNSFQGAPSAREALFALSEEVMTTVLEELNAEWLVHESPTAKDVLSSLFARHLNIIPEDKRELIKNYIDKNYLEFCKAYSS